MAEQRHPVLLPDLGLSGAVTVSVWHAARGDRVYEGDRLVEILAGEVTIDLPAPATGRLVEKCVEVDDEITAGQLLGIVAEPGEDAGQRR